MDKFDFKKEYKEIYKVKRPAVVDFPTARYIALSGEGSPDSPLFQSSIEALYGVAYAISMSYKGSLVIEGFHQFVVPPLEGVWDLIDVDKGYDGNKDNLKWDIMIMMPDFVTEAVLSAAKRIAYEKKGNELTNEIKLLISEGKKCCVALHVGPYALEPKTFSDMEKFTADNGYERTALYHREIYLSDFRKTEESNLKTVLSYEI